MNEDKLQIGDRVLINNKAFDEQVERMVDQTIVYIVSEVKDVELEGTTGQWIKVERGIRLINHYGEVRIEADWIDKGWCQKHE